MKKYKIYVKQYVEKTIEAEDLDSVKDWMSSCKWSDYNFVSEAHTIVDESTGETVEEIE
jgi:hypothetical protein|tara:strand:+ start:53 stop:229 length:177 start_codon:yes stop_codon:yes gene_type:complete